MSKFSENGEFPARQVTEAAGQQSVAVGSDVTGVVQTGDGSQAFLVQSGAPRTPDCVDIRPGLNHIPMRTGLFVGRAEQLARLDSALSKAGQTVVHAVHGLGGIGKSTLAAHWAANHNHACYPVRWIAADTLADIEVGLAELATDLEPALAAIPSRATQAQWAVQWLATHTGWLLILDNADSSADIEPLLARASGGKFLITSRSAVGWREAATIALDVLDEDEALELFNRIATSAGPRHLVGAAEVCAELGYLPLAIEQSAAYLAQNPLITPLEYLDLFRNYPGAMYGAGAEDIQEERTIARIWRLTLDKIAARQPIAGDVLRALAWYSTDAIPDVVPAALFAGASEPPEVNSALGLLAAYSMISIDTQSRTYSVHRLVQAFLRTPDDDDPHRTAQLIDRARDFATHLHLALPETSRDAQARQTWDALIPHIDHLFGQSELRDFGEAYVLFSAGDYLIDIGESRKAIKYLERALAGCLEFLSAGNPQTLTCSHNLATAYHGVGDYERAIQLYELTAEARRLALGEAGKETLVTLSNLGCAYSESGEPEKGIPLLRFVVEHGDSYRGEDAMTIRRNLSRAYQNANDLDSARSLGEEALAVGVENLGLNHPEVIRTQHDLVHIYQDMGDHQAVLRVVRIVLGGDHEKSTVTPDMLDSLHCMALASSNAGGHAEAAQLLERVVAHAIELSGNEEEIDVEYYRRSLAQNTYRGSD
ncbi:tetratricopeptide repeat protein [Streptomyces beigongshangae]|uniref:tetratricopeptide repeat protein n=1 Tax=Streptomyces beigongshangae TaxID=2841597 RepID=UPI001C85FDBF|nr:tetratricopeptide repeat protein [Streptomyces sp. REN17]